MDSISEAGGVLERALVQDLARPGQVGHHDAEDPEAELLLVFCVGVSLADLQHLELVLNLTSMSRATILLISRRDTYGSSGLSPALSLPAIAWEIDRQ
jgi:hypothetical protein